MTVCSTDSKKKTTLEICKIALQQQAKEQLGSLVNYLVSSLTALLQLLQVLYIIGH